LLELAALFLKLGTTAFGGPAAHIAMMEDEVVGRRRWLTRAQFLDFVGATNLIPGPNSTELAIHIGRERAGWKGLVVAGISFIVPAALIVAAIAWGYRRYGSLPQSAALLYGVKPVVIAVVVQALWRLGRVAIRSATLLVLTVAAVLAAAWGVNELLVLLLAGVAMAATRVGRTPRPAISGVAVVLVASGALVTAVAAQAVAPAPVPFGLWLLFLVFAKAGAVLFGSGYVLLAFLRADLVSRLRWLTESQLLDAIAVGQVTPGPVFTTATFIGYVLGGPAGAAVATLGIFLPAFVFVALSGPLIPRLRASPTAGAVLDGVNAASLALMTVVSWELGRAALVDAVTIVAAAVSLLVLTRWRINSAWLIGAGAALGLLLH
jgi:chromate transporter